MPDSDFTTVGEIFSREHNPDRKKTFDIRTLMLALVDQDHVMLERWAGMAETETAVVADAHLGGVPVCLLGIESRPVPRRGFPSTDGPDTYTAGTLLVPTLVEEGRPGDQRGQREPDPPTYLPSGAMHIWPVLVPYRREHWSHAEGPAGSGRA